MPRDYTTNTQIKKLLERQHDEVSQQLTEITRMLADHEKRLCLLEDHNGRHDKRLSILETRERETAISQARMARMSALIASIVTGVLSLIATAISSYLGAH